MIIIEGPDNSGKTSLIESIRREFPSLKYIHSSGPDKDAEEFKDRLSNVYMNMGQHNICDRFPVISEQIYGPILRGKINFELSFPSLMVDICIKKKPLIIYCRPSFENLLNFGDREDLEGVVDNAVELINSYDKNMRIVHGANINKGGVFIYNWETTKKDFVHDLVIHHLSQ